MSADQKEEIKTDEAVKEGEKAAEDRAEEATPEATELLKKKPVKSG